MTNSSNPPGTDPKENLPAYLARGHSSFRRTRLLSEQDRFRNLAEFGQKPPTLLIGCCDSRVSPEIIFDVGPGEIFVIRNIGALVPPYGTDNPLPETATAIEYAVIALKVAHIVVMGHAQCGGIRAFASGEVDMLKPLSEADFVGRWTRLIQPASERIGPAVGDFNHHCENLSRASIIQGLANLRTYPWVRERETVGKITLHGAFFDVADGDMTVLDEARGTFVPVISAAG